jgi:osmoprotectant transport system substrate-binding protein
MSRRSLNRRSRLAGTAMGSLLLMLPAACGLQSGNIVTSDLRPGSIGAGRPLDGAELTVTSKEFTEQLILGQILGLALEASGARVNDKTNIQGSIGSREAIKQGVADVMYEYTGTGWITYLGHTKPITDPQRQWQVVHDADLKNGITWLPPAKLNNTYAFAVTAKTQKKTGVRTDSEFAALTKKDPAAATACIDPEFGARDDGWQGAKKTYGFKINSSGTKVMQSGLVYSQLSKGGVCTVGEVFATDGRIPGLNLKVLTDDKHFFPNYNAAPVVYTKTLKAYPAIAEILDPISKKLNNSVAQHLNEQVDVDGKDPREVAEAWLLEEGFVKRPG